MRFRRVNPVLPVLAQGFLSAGQIGVTVVGTLVMAPDDWGVFAILLSVFFVANGFVRGFGTLPLLTRTAGDADDAGASRGAALLMSMLSAVPAGAVIVIVSAAVSAASTGWILAAALVTYSFYDCVRSAELASNRALRVAVSDAVLMLILLSGSAIAALVPVDTGSALAAAMAIAYGLMAYALARQAPVPVPRTLRAFFIEHRRDMFFFAADGVLMGLSITVFVLVLGSTTSLAAAGAFRTAATTIAGPLQMVLTGLMPLVIARARADARQRTGARALQLPLLLTGVAATAGVVWGGAASLLAASLSPRGELGVFGHALTLGLPACALIVGLWSASAVSSCLRYHCTSAELTAVRVATFGCSAAILWLGPSVPGTTPWSVVLSAAIPWLVLPNVYALGRLAIPRPVHRATGLARTRATRRAVEALPGGAAVQEGGRGQADG